jgi:methylated-DNA-[protein]-cysteine S-methyltransferase
MRCSDVEALCDEMLEGIEPRNDHVVAHLRRCRDCQDMYAQFEGVAYCLSCLPIVEPPQSLVPRILDHIKSSVRTRRAGTNGSSTSPDSLALLDSPLGTLAIGWRKAGITFVGIARENDFETIRTLVERRLRRPVVPADAPAWVRETVAAFFATWRVDERVLDVSGLTVFERAALEKAAEIPPGEVRSYGWIAREIGHPQAARAVGQAMARNPLALFFPCHRVVDANGGLHNYGYGVDVKARILRMEGYRAVR